MDLTDKRVLLTGASGGIGRALAITLAARGARLILTGRSQTALQATAELASDHDPYLPIVIPAELSDRDGCVQLLRRCQDAVVGIDLLINNAGCQTVGPFSAEDPVALERAVQLNLLAPMLLTRLVLPDMIARGHGTIANIGSAFGSIGFACYASYSATKFGLRGFSEALRRELADDPIHVCYIAPRATATRLVDTAMASEVGMTVDAPSDVAAQIVRAIERDRAETIIGAPENIFTRINALLPRLVDRATRKQNRRLRDLTLHKEPA